MNPCFVFAESNTGALAFSTLQAARSTSYHAIEKLIFANGFVIRFVSDSLLVQRDTLKYPEMWLVEL